MGCCLPTNNRVLYQIYRKRFLGRQLLSPHKQQGTIPPKKTVRQLERLLSPHKQQGTIPASGKPLALSIVVVSPQTTGYYT